MTPSGREQAAAADPGCSALPEAHKALRFLQRHSKGSELARKTTRGHQIREVLIFIPRWLYRKIAADPVPLPTPPSLTNAPSAALKTQRAEAEYYFARSMTLGYLTAAFGALIVVAFNVAGSLDRAGSTDPTSTPTLRGSAFSFTDATTFVTFLFVLLLIAVAWHFAGRTSAAEREAPHLRHNGENRLSLLLLYAVPAGVCGYLGYAHLGGFWGALILGIPGAVLGGQVGTVVAMVAGFHDPGDLDR